MTSPTISVQLYSLDDELRTDLDGTLARLATIGFDTVEAFDFVHRAPELATAFARHGLAARTGHAPLASDLLPALDGSVRPADSLDVTFEAAAVLGLSIVVDPYVEPTRWHTRSDVIRTAERLSAAALTASTHGVRVGYHNHDHELRARIGDRSALEVFAEALDPDVVLEVDLYWVAAAGLDPAELLRNLGSRVVAVHVKDGALADVVTGQVPSGQVPAGQGEVPLRAALDAASGLEFAVIEFDAYVGDTVEAIGASYRFVREVLG